MTEREQFEKVRSALEEYTQIPFMSSMGESLNQCCRTLASEGHADDCRGAEALKILEAWQAARATPASTFGTELSARIDAMLNKVFICANNEQQKTFNRMVVLLADCKAALTTSAIPALPQGVELETFVPVDKLPAALAIELSRLRDFRSAVIGWRESDHPEGFCRKTAEFVVLLGQIAAKDELK